MTIPILQTLRLHLREIVASDAEAIFALRSDYEVTRHNIGAAYTELAQAHALIEGIAEDVMAGVPRWGIALRQGDNRLIGMVGYNSWERHDQRASVGFDLARAHWGGGIMSEALRCVIGYGFDEMALNKIEADTSEHNAASMALLRKTGFREEGRLREQFYEDGRFHDLVLWGLLKREWTP